MKSLLLILLCYLSICGAFRPQITFHTEWGCSGDDLTLQSKQPDLIAEAPRIIKSWKTYSLMGLWVLYTKADYTGSTGLVGGSQTVHCVNGTLDFSGAARYLGPSETTTPSISFYEDEYYVGREVTITGPASANIPFLPKSLMSTGATSWTLYSGKDFDGIATCYVPPAQYWFQSLGVINETLSNTRSVLRGCDRHIDHYFY